MSWKVHLEPLIRFGLPGYRMYVRRENYDGSFEIIKSPVLMEHKDPHSFAVPGDAMLDDSAMLPIEHRVDVRGFLQAMSDAAWEIGIRPRGLEGHTDELRAVRYHLEDMRQLAGVKK